jgi:hypothetical protein
VIQELTNEMVNFFFKVAKLDHKRGAGQRYYLFFLGGFVCALYLSSPTYLIAIFFYCSSSKSELPRLDDNGSLYNLKALGALCLGSLLKYLKR